MKKIPWKFLLPALVLLIIDQWVKMWARDSVSLGQSLGYPWPGVFEIKLAYNYGIAFGLMEGRGIFFAPVALGIIGYATFWCVKHPKETSFTYFTIGMLVAGALGNLIDRVAHGKVTDMFWFRLINFPVFNVADACITISATLLFFRSLKSAEIKSSESLNDSSAVVHDISHETSEVKQ